MSNPNDPIEMCRECHTLHPRSGPCAPVRISDGTEPWREAWERGPNTSYGGNIDFFAAGWQALASLPELREVLEKAEKLIDLPFDGIDLIRADALGPLSTALTALKARMVMP